MDNFKGFSLFNDVEDKGLRVYNRARILVNMAEDNTDGNRITAKGASLILGYFSNIPVEEREDVKNSFKNLMIKEGFILEG